MLGFGPVSAPLGEAMTEVNEALRGYHAWHELLDGFLQIVPLDYRYVLDWRVEAERKMRARGQAGMSDAEILAYVEKFLPAYETYLPALSRASPVGENVLRVTVARDRLPSF